MKALANISIRSKLMGIVIISTVLSVVGGFTLVIKRTINVYEEELLENTGILAELVGKEVGFFIEFEECGDSPDAQRTINTLEKIPWVSGAYFFDTQRNLCVQYPYDDRVGAPENILGSDACELGGGFVHCFHHVDYEDPGSGEETDVGVFYLRASTEDYHEKIRQLVTYMGFLMIAVLGAATLLAYLLQGVISKPILHLAKMAQYISDQADYSVRVKKPGHDEIGTLYDGFNNMLKQIQKRQEDLTRSNRDLDQFAYVASHDLKAPLRAIATLSGWIEEDLRDELSPEASEQMRLLRSRVQRMDQLIDGILQYSRAGRLENRGKRVDVGEMLRDLVELLSPPDGFRVRIGRGMPTMVTKHLRLEQVFSNLINNAIKYHDRPDGKVEVRARRRGRFYEFSVIDDGPGIAEEHHDKVFMMFQTLQPRDQVESTGLGLSLVKKLVEEEGGSIHLESSPGRGACFRFTWPASVGDESSEDVEP